MTYFSKLVAVPSKLIIVSKATTCAGDSVVYWVLINDFLSRCCWYSIIFFFFVNPIYLKILIIIYFFVECRRENLLKEERIFGLLTIVSCLKSHYFGVVRGLKGGMPGALAAVHWLATQRPTCLTFMNIICFISPLLLRHLLERCLR